MSRPPPGVLGGRAGGRALLVRAGLGLVRRGCRCLRAAVDGVGRWSPGAGSASPSGAASGRPRAGAGAGALGLGRRSAVRRVSRCGSSSPLAAGLPRGPASASAGRRCARRGASRGCRSDGRHRLAAAGSSACRFRASAAVRRRRCRGSSPRGACRAVRRLVVGRSRGRGAAGARVGARPPRPCRTAAARSRRSRPRCPLVRSVSRSRHAGREGLGSMVCGRRGAFRPGTPSCFPRRAACVHGRGWVTVSGGP